MLRQFPPSPRLHVAQFHLRGKQMSHLRQTDVSSPCIFAKYLEDI